VAFLPSKRLFHRDSALHFDILYIAALPTGYEVKTGNSIHLVSF